MQAAKEWINSLPIITKSIIATCAIIHLVSVIIGFDNYGSICLAPAYAFQPWRLITAHLFHVNILHVSLNLMAFAPLASSQEHARGSSRFAMALASIWTASDIIYMATTFLTSHLLPGISLLSGCAVGLSGIVFALIAIDALEASEPQRSIFGLFSVPTKTYPFALLLFWQLVVPSASLMGHLSGLLAGLLWKGVEIKFLEDSETSEYSQINTTLI
jgi:rhomboid domain-containing protein 1